MTRGHCFVCEVPAAFVRGGQFYCVEHFRQIAGRRPTPSDHPSKWSAPCSHASCQGSDSCRYELAPTPEELERARTALRRVQGGAA